MKKINFHWCSATQDGLVELHQALARWVFFPHGKARDVYFVQKEYFYLFVRSD